MSSACGGSDLEQSSEVTVNKDALTSSTKIDCRLPASFISSMAMLRVTGLTPRTWTKKFSESLYSLLRETISLS